MFSNLRVHAWTARARLPGRNFSRMQRGFLLSPTGYRMDGSFAETRYFNYGTLLRYFVYRVARSHIECKICKLDNARNILLM